MITPLVYVASVYGSGQYDRSTYGGSATTSTASGGSTGSSAGGMLGDTGIAVIGIVTLAAMILLVALAVRIWKRPSKKVVAQEVETDDRAA